MLNSKVNLPSKIQIQTWIEQVPKGMRAQVSVCVCVFVCVVEEKSTGEDTSGTPTKHYSSALRRQNMH